MLLTLTDPQASIFTTNHWLRKLPIKILLIALPTVPCLSLRYLFPTSILVYIVSDISNFLHLLDSLQVRQVLIEYSLPLVCLIEKFTRHWSTIQPVLRLYGLELGLVMHVPPDLLL